MVDQVTAKWNAVLDSPEFRAGYAALARLPEPERRRFLRELYTRVAEGLRAQVAVDA